MIFDRVKPLEAILATAEKKSLHRSLGAFDLTMLGIGAIIGTGIFVLTAVAANKAGPGMMYSFVIAGVVCALTALIYSEIAAMVPVSGSAYTYTYAVMGELLAWMVGWALILEYGVAASAVAVGWSGYANGWLHAIGVGLPAAFSAGPLDPMMIPDSALFLDEVARTLPQGVQPLSEGVVKFADGSAFPMTGAIEVPNRIGSITLPLPTKVDLEGAVVMADGAIRLADGRLMNSDLSFKGGTFNLIAFLLSLLVAGLLVLGTSKSAKFTAVLVIVKIVALVAFIALAFPAVKASNFEPMLPNGWGTPMGGIGVLGAAASIFFAYVGFDAVSTAAEETKNPNRNIPIGLIASLAVCTVIYLLVSYSAVGAIGAQPGGPLSNSPEPLAFVLRQLGHEQIGNWVAIAAIIALPSVVLMMIFGQTRILFTMARDGLLPESLSKVHSKFQTPYVITWVVGIAVAIFSALFPVGVLADISNSGTLFAFFMVAVGVLILRRTQPNRKRPFKTPFVWVVGPLAAAGCLLLFFSLGTYTLSVFLIWATLGLLVYFVYSRSRSHVGRGLTEVHEDDAGIPPPPVAPIS